MKKEYKISGMNCNHCRAAVEEALNTITDVKATVTLNPPVAVIEYEGSAPSLVQLQDVIVEEAGNYTISE